MKMSQVKDLLIELLIFTCVVGLFILSFIKFNILVFEIKSMVIFYISIIGVIFFVFSFSRIINIGTKILVDFIFQKTKEDEFEFVGNIHYEASGFAPKSYYSFKSLRRTNEQKYFLVHMKKDDTVYVFLSQDSLDFEINKKYRVKSGYFSGILLCSTPIEMS